MTCSLYNGADTCNGNCETCTDLGKAYDRFDMYKYQQLTDYGIPSTTTICCPACKRMKTYLMEDYWEHTKEYLAQGDCKACKRYRDNGKRIVEKPKLTDEQVKNLEEDGFFDDLEAQKHRLSIEIFNEE